MSVKPDHDRDVLCLQFRPLLRCRVEAEVLPQVVLGLLAEASHSAWVRCARKLDNVVSADELFSVLRGEDVESRRSFITRNAKDVRFLDVG